MNNPGFTINPLSLNQLTRDLWGQPDAAAIAQIAPLTNDDCYRPKLYKAPGDNQELFAANGYVLYGLKVTPGSILYGIYYPVPNPGTNPLGDPGWSVQIQDMSLNRYLFSEPISSIFIANYKPTYQSRFLERTGSFPHLFTSPYPVVGDGLFQVEIWETGGIAQRIQLCIGAFEPCE